MVRTFVALELSDEIRQKIREAQDILVRSRARLTLVKPESAHITLKFLGEVEAGQIDSIIHALQSVHSPPFEISIEGVGGNSASHPRVIWGIVRDRGESAVLAMQVEKVLEPLGFPREKRGFRPHATIARVREFDPTLLQQLHLLATTPLGKTRITSLKLKKSTLTPSGPIYEDLAEVTL